MPYFPTNSQGPDTQNLTQCRKAEQEVRAARDVSSENPDNKAFHLPRRNVKGLWKLLQLAYMFHE